MAEYLLYLVVLFDNSAKNAEVKLVRKFHSFSLKLIYMSVLHVRQEHCLTGDREMM